MTTTAYRFTYTQHIRKHGPVGQAYCIACAPTISDEDEQVDPPIGDGDDWLSERLDPLSADDSLA